MPRSDTDPAPELRKCASCPRTTAQDTDGPLKSCARCGLIFYCSTNCQRRDWRRHKTEECRARKKLPLPPPEKARYSKTEQKLLRSVAMDSTVKDSAVCAKSLKSGANVSRAFSMMRFTLLARQKRGCFYAGIPDGREPVRLFTLVWRIIT